MIALIDCNNFYVSCEQVFNPMLLGKALLILSNNDGCAISRSEEAKRLGITMGTPAFMIKEKISQYSVEVRSSNYTLYGDMSERVMQVIRQFFPKTEVYSIDEVFADLTGLSYVNFHSLALEVREAVRAHTGIPISIGIAPTKTLSKLANRYAKKTRRNDGVFYAQGEEVIREMLSCMDAGEVWGIGAQHAALLKESGFQTAADFLNAPEEWVRKNLSVVGQRTQMELKGIPAIPWEEKPAAKKKHLYRAVIWKTGNHKKRNGTGSGSLHYQLCG